MGAPILRRHDREKEEEDPRYRQTLENEVVTPPPGFPTEPPSNDYPKIESEIESEYDFEMSGPSDGAWRSKYLHGWPPTPSFTTATRPSLASPMYPDHAKSSTVSPTLLSATAQPQPAPTSSGNGDGLGEGNDASLGDKDGPNHRVMPIVAGVAGMVIMAVIGFIIFFCLRKRKRQRQVLATQARVQEMKARSQASMLPRMGTSPIYSQYAAPPSQPLPAAVASPPPVILGPIVPGSNGAYYTGIDTSDIVSMHDRPAPDRTGLGNPFADGDSLNEEPPPPYRPRSLAPMSRNTSLRAPPSFTSSQTHLIGGHDQSLGSPFVDPPDDDAISDISGPTRRNYDGLSIVSDMSYQEEPVVIRPAI